MALQQYMAANLSLANVHITPFDPVRCAELYNAIVDKAVAMIPRMHIGVQSGSLIGPYPDAPAHHPNYPDDPLEDHISESLVEFLQLCNRPSGREPDAHVFPHVRPIDAGILFLFDDMIKYDGGSSIVCLMRDEYSRGGGLMFDQNTGLARYWVYPEWIHVHEGGWVPLDSIFRRWLKWHELGKIIVDAGERHPDDPPVPDVTAPDYDGYIQMSFNSMCEWDLQQTLGTWSRLLDVITQRLPSGVIQVAQPGYGLIAEVDLRDDMPLAARLFLSQARRPPVLVSKDTFRIAPAIAVPSVATVVNPNNLPRYQKHYQILFQVVGPDGRPSSTNLYLIDDGGFKDGAQFSKQMPDGRLEYARSFRAVSSTNRTLTCPWHGSRPHRLNDMLQTWIRLIEDGVWTVGEAGVEGDESLLHRTGSTEGRLRWEDVEI